MFSVLTSVSAQLLGLVSTSVCGNFLLAPPCIGATDLARRYAVKRLNRSVMAWAVLGGDRNFGPGAEQLAHAADVDDDVVADLDRPILEQRRERSQIAAPGLVRRIDQQENLPPFAR